MRLHWMTLLILVATGAWAETDVWTSIGPFGGSARALAISPRNSSVVYVGTTGGIFKTTDGGASWRLSNSGLPPGFIARCLAIDPQTPDTIYAGGSGKSGWTWNDRVFKSTDGGATWKGANSGLEDVIFVESLAIDPQNPGRVYAGTSACVLGACYNAAVFKTTDGGTSWSGVSSGLPWAAQTFALIGALAVDPQDSSTIYAGARGGGVFKSSDGGRSWNQVRAAPVAAGLVIDPVNPNTIYAAIANGVAKSVDGGATWDATNTGLPAANCCASLALDPQNTNTLYVGFYYGGVFKSVDGGLSWADTGLPRWDETHIAVPVDSENPSPGLAIDPQQSGTIYAATPGSGIFKSTDGARNWTAVNSGLSATSVMSVAVDARNAGTIYAATGVGVLKTTDGGASWSAAGSGLPGSSFIRSLVIDPLNSETIYAGIAGLGMFKSTDGGASWSGISPALDVRGYPGLVTVDPRNSGVLYAGDFERGGPGFSADMLKSTDGGVTWTSSGSFGNWFTALVIDPQNPNNVYAGDGWQIYKTADGGDNWSDIDVPLPADYDCDECTPISTLAIDPRDSNTVYSGGSIGILKSTDGGSNWRLMNSGLGTLSDWIGVAAIGIDPRDSNILYATISGKIFKSTDGAESWCEAVSGLTVTSVGSFVIDVATDTVYAASDGGGIFAITAPSTLRMSSNSSVWARLPTRQVHEFSRDGHCTPYRFPITAGKP